MTEVVLFPDATALIVDYLADIFPAVHVGSRVPDPRPTQFITVNRGGGVRHTIVSDAPQMLIECWADQPEDAHDLAQLARAYLLALPGEVLDGVVICRVDELAGPADLPDPLSNQPRTVFTVIPHVRGASAVGS